MSQMIRIIETPVEVLDLLQSPFKYADSANLPRKANRVALWDQLEDKWRQNIRDVHQHQLTDGISSLLFFFRLISD